MKTTTITSFSIIQVLNKLNLIPFQTQREAFNLILLLTKRFKTPFNSFLILPFSCSHSLSPSLLNSLPPSLPLSLSPSRSLPTYASPKKDRGIFSLPKINFLPQWTKNGSLEGRERWKWKGMEGNGREWNGCCFRESSWLIFLFHPSIFSLLFLSFCSFLLLSFLPLFLFLNFYPNLYIHFGFFFRHLRYPYSFFYSLLSFLTYLFFSFLRPSFSFFRFFF